MQTTANDLAERSKNGGGVDKEDTIQSIDTMITRVENLKRKVCETTHPRQLSECLKSPALGFKRECRHTYSSSDEGTSPTSVGRGRCANSDYP